jgi:hypothetical protein
MKPGIHRLPAAQIDAAKWDRCVQRHSNGLLYSTTTYLNALCQQWEGWIINDYEAILALPTRKKWGIRYAYTPPFIQQLGIIGQADAGATADLLTMIQGTVAYADIHFNFSNSSVLQNIPVTSRTNLVIPLDRPLSQIHTHYTNDLRENIRKAAGEQLVYAHAGLHEAIDHFQDQYAARMKQVVPSDYDNFLCLCEQLQINGQCLVRAVTDADKALLAIVLLLKDDRRIYNLMNTTLPAGRNKEANHFLLDNVIREFAGQPLLFDLEGSEIPGVKKFYSSFGAENQPYFHYHYNGLPWPMQLLKR